MDINENPFKNGARWHSLNTELQKQYGHKVYKISLQSGCGCPNRDGTVGTGGCSFCSAGGSGDFAAQPADLNTQIIEAKEKIHNKAGTNASYIAYFQSYTNTYGPLDKLEALYSEAALRPDITALSVGTRPDCLEEPVLDMLERINRIKPVWIELGLQTIHDDIAERINRCYTTRVFEETYLKLKERGFNVVLHIILGLPGESREMMRETIRRITSLYQRAQHNPVIDTPFDGIKLQLLHLLEGTPMARDYCKQPFHIMTMNEYIDIVIDSLELLPPEWVIHRVTGDGPKKLLIEPQWSANKKNVLNTLQKRIVQRDSWQGKCFNNHDRSDEAYNSKEINI